MVKNILNQIKKIKGLHFAIPVLLIILGFCLIVIAAYTIAKPYLSISNLFIDTENKSSSNISSSKIMNPQTSGSIIYSGFGEIMGHLTIKNAGIDSDVYHGDHDAQLKKGIGHFAGSCYPGEGGKIILDAHRESYFKNIKNVKLGDTALFKTLYGEYKYNVYDIKIVKATDSSVLLADNSNEYLIMYTCYPFDTIGYKPDRYLVYAKLVNNIK